MLAVAVGVVVRDQRRAYDLVSADNQIERGPSVCWKKKS
jgi:hypothetical protein